MYSGMANRERISATIRRHVFHVDAKEYAYVWTHGGPLSLRRGFLQAARFFDSVGTAQASCPPCTHQAGEFQSNEIARNYVQARA